jgi:hypothetical protein
MRSDPDHAPSPGQPRPPRGKSGAPGRQEPESAKPGRPPVPEKDPLDYDDGAWM